MAREDSGVVVRLLTTFSMSASCTELGTFLWFPITALLLAGNEFFSFLFFLFWVLPSGGRKSERERGGGARWGRDRLGNGVKREGGRLGSASERGERRERRERGN